MPAYKLYYFALRGRGEPARLLFAAAGVDFEDVRISFDDWPKHKQNMPFRQMPVLEVDGKQLSQSYAIARYLANEFGFAGKNKWEAAEADQFTGAVEDLFGPIVTWKFEIEDEAQKAAALKKFKEESAPNVLQVFEATLGKSSSGFLVGDELTYVDLIFLNLLDFMDGTMQTDSKAVLSAFPNIQKHRQKIQALPKIAAWVQKRADDEY